MDNIREKTKKFLLDLFFPKFCLGCQKEGIYLCDDCRSLLEISEYDYCLCPSDQSNRQTAGKCPKCQDKSLSGLYFALAYKQSALVKKLIYQFKYAPYLKDLAKTLASIVAEHFIKTGDNINEVWAPKGYPSILVSVPLDQKKFRLRNYNQSEELAKELSKIVKVPVALDCLTKIKETKPQAESKKEERENNLLGAFIIKNPEEISGKKVFLVDDVYTTGSTMEECAKVLRKAGAKSVWGIALAREG